jgi:FkbM family methyltransferase
MLTTKQKIMLASSANRLVQGWRKLCGQKMEGDFHRGDITWHLDLNEGIDFSIYLLGNYEPGTVKFYSGLVRPGDTVFDVGANIGAHTLNFARLVGDAGKVCAFEPTLSAIRKLEGNLALNPALRSRVQLFHSFCSNPGDVDIPNAIYSSWPLHAQPDLHPKHLGSLQAVGTPQLIVLDELAAKLALPRLDLIKLDVDGNEIKVLKGCDEILRRHHPKVIAEVVPYVMAENGLSMEDFWAPFRKHNYKMRTFENADPVPLDTAYFEKNYPEFSSVNVLLY